MDGAAVKNGTPGFQTPPRILIPKLVKSRDGWKQKANARKRKLKAAKVRVRDLEASRDSWRERALAAEKASRDLQGEQAKKADVVVADVVARAEAQQLGGDLKKTSSTSS